MPEPDNTAPEDEASTAGGPGEQLNEKAPWWHRLLKSPGVYMLPVTAAINLAYSLADPMVLAPASQGEVSGFPGGEPAQVLLHLSPSWWERVWLSWSDLSLLVVFTLAAVVLSKVEFPGGRLRFPERMETKLLALLLGAAGATLLAMFMEAALSLYAHEHWGYSTSPPNGITEKALPFLAMAVPLGVMATVYQAGRSREEELEKVV